MSTDPDAPEGGEIHVADEEGIVDRKTKEHILSLRKQIDDDERQLYVELVASGRISRQEADEYWGISIRQYLRGIKRLWNSDSDQAGVRNVEFFWEKKEIAEFDLPPPDAESYQFSTLDYDAEDLSSVKRSFGLPRTAELPEPRKQKFKGLQSVLSTRGLHETWRVKVNDSGPPPEHDYLTLERSMPVPKFVLEQAIETADNFLQQAGIGFETTVPPYMGGDEPGI
jgi:hypothetical protein